jgi:hypothetical protein
MQKASLSPDWASLINSVSLVTGNYPLRDVNSIDTLYEIWLAAGCFFLVLEAVAAIEIGASVHWRSVIALPVDCNIAQAGGALSGDGPSGYKTMPNSWLSHPSPDGRELLHERTGDLKGVQEFRHFRMAFRLSFE